MGQQWTQNPGQTMPGQQDDNRRQVQGTPNEQDKTGETPDNKTPGRGHGE